MSTNDDAQSDASTKEPYGGDAVDRLIVESETADFVLFEIRSRIALAERLGVQPLTVAERAEALLAKACNGWRRRKVCQDRSGAKLMHPHPACIWAQYHHDALLLDHGILQTDRLDPIAGLTARIPLSLLDRVVTVLASDAAHGASLSPALDPGETFTDVHTWLRLSHPATAQRLLISFRYQLGRRGIDRNHPSFGPLMHTLSTDPAPTNQPNSGGTTRNRGSGRTHPAG